MNNKIEKLNKPLIDELIENIYVYDNGTVKIHFKYKDEFDDVIKFLKTKGSMI